MSETEDISQQIQIGNVLYALLNKTGPVEVPVAAVLNPDIGNKKLMLTYNENTVSFTIELGEENGNNEGV